MSRQSMLPRRHNHRPYYHNAQNHGRIARKQTATFSMDKTGGVARFELNNCRVVVACRTSDIKVHITTRAPHPGSVLATPRRHELIPSRGSTTIDRGSLNKTQRRVRRLLRRGIIPESPLLSPNDPEAWSSSDEMFLVANDDAGRVWCQGEGEVEDERASNRHAVGLHEQSERGVNGIENFLVFDKGMTTEEGSDLDGVEASKPVGTTRKPDFVVEPTAAAILSCSPHADITAAVATEEDDKLEVPDSQAV